MRIPSGVTDQYIYFVAVDSTDFTTRETGLSSFTVYRSRDGGAAAAMTTPTINETDATNMPGVYELLLDEDMTIGASNLSEEMAFHITHAGMAPVTRTIELYQANGSGLTAIPWNASWDAEVQSEVTDALNAYDPPTKAELDSGLAGLNDISTAEVNAEVVDALNVDTYAEPGQGAPGATISLAAKINYLYKSWRNKKSADSDSVDIYNDAGDTIDHSAAVSDDGTTTTRGEMGTGA